MLRLLPVFVACSALGIGCSGSDGDRSDSEVGLSPAQLMSITTDPAEGERLDVDIRRTTAGVPHIRGSNLASVTAGLGDVQAEDNLCLLAEGFVKVRGERARFFGRGPDDSYVISDLSYKALGLRSEADDPLADASDVTAAMVRGFVAGYNHYLASSGAARCAAVAIGHFCGSGRHALAE